MDSKTSLYSLYLAVLPSQLGSQNPATAPVPVL